MRTASLLLCTLLTAAAAPEPPPAPAPTPSAPPLTRHRVAGGPDAPALVLVHGNFDRLETWDAVVPELSKTFRVVTLDLPGYGETPAPQKPYIDSEYWAGEVRRVLDSLGVGRAVLVGNSMGGTVVARFAATWPERTAGLVFEDANFNSTFPEDSVRGHMRDLFLAAQKLAAAPEDAAARRAVRDATEKALRAALRPEHVTDALVDHFARGFEPARFAAMDRQKTYMEYRELANDLLAAAAKTPVPILAVWGLDDPLVPLEGGERVRQQFPSSRLVVLGDCGHAPHLERPAEFVAVVREAFGPGGALPTHDRFVPGPGPAPDPLAPRLADWPFTRGAIFRHLQATAPSPLHSLGVAEACRDTGDLACSREALPKDVASLPQQDRARALFVQGYLRLQDGDEARGTELLVQALAAQKDFSRAPRHAALGLLAGASLSPAQAKVVDARLFPVPADGVEEEAVRRARVDRLVALERYAEALAEIERGWGEELYFAGDRFRKARALFGAGRWDDADDLLFEVGHQLESYLRNGAPGTTDARRNEAMQGCIQWLRRAARIEAGLRLPAEPVRCEPPPELLSDWPADALLLRDQAAYQSLAAAAGLPRARLTPHAKEPWAASALAEAELRAGRPAKALAALKKVPLERAAQSPGFLKLLLGLRAEAGDRKALAEAQRLAAAHPGDVAWQELLAVVLLASGRAADARDLLVPLVEANPPVNRLRLHLSDAHVLARDGAPPVECAGCFRLPARFAYEKRASGAPRTR